MKADKRNTEKPATNKSDKNKPQRDWDVQPGERNPDPVVQKIQREEEEGHQKKI